MTRMENDDERLDLNASCCMEIAGIESMLNIDAPKAKDMLNGDSGYDLGQYDSSSNCI